MGNECSNCNNCQKAERQTEIKYETSQLNNRKENDEVKNVHSPEIDLQNEFQMDIHHHSNRNEDQISEISREEV